MWVNTALANDKILLLNSYHPQYKWTSELTNGVRDAISNDIKPENLFIEYMDQRRFIDDPIYNKKLINLLKYKYTINKPDIVITSDDGAYNFMLDYGDQLFPNIPIVFCGVNVFNPIKIAHKKNITGIAEGMEIEGNLDLIINLQPEVKRIIVLGDTTGLGLRMVNEAIKLKPEWEKKTGVKIEIWDRFSMHDLYSDVAELPDNMAILILAIHKDKLGQYFSYEEHLLLLSQHSHVPIYGMWGAIMIGNGVIGGMMNDPYEHGFNTASIALKIIDGTPIDQLPIKMSAIYKPKFDYNQLVRFGLEDSEILKKAKVYNKPVSIYQKNKSLINSGITIIIILLLMISILLRNNYLKRVAQKELKDFNLKLESTIKIRTDEIQQRNKELELASAAMKKLAHTDTLTGLKNRRAASKDIPAYINRYNISYKPFVIAMLDIDYFKKVNDNFGHQTGDNVLELIAKELTQCLRPEDRIYRWGGEEFIMFLSGASINDAKEICKRISTSINSLVIGEVKNITVSVGLTEFVQNDNYDSIVNRADEALYQAKNTGRNKYMIG
jgi:diguanylate cyclase (GGDEF)-like protein